MLRKLQSQNRARSTQSAGFLIALLLVSFTPASAGPKVVEALRNQNAHVEPSLIKDKDKKFASVSAVIDEYGKTVRSKLKPLFSSYKINYPPHELTWICLKEEKKLLVFAKDGSGNNRMILKYPIIGASGGAGPKLREGDKQVPEGFYQITEFRPRIIAHIGLAVDYPNGEDIKNAFKEHRSKLGGDILIHGSLWSTGCLAMGNAVIEELFLLAYDCGYKNVKLIFAPCNLLLSQPHVDFKKQPDWLPSLYDRLRAALKEYPLPGENEHMNL